MFSVYGVHNKCAKFVKIQSLKKTKQKKQTKKNKKKTQNKTNKQKTNKQKTKNKQTKNKKTQNKQLPVILIERDIFSIFQKFISRPNLFTEDSKTILQRKRCNATTLKLRYYDDVYFLSEYWTDDTLGK